MPTPNAFALSVSLMPVLHHRYAGDVYEEAEDHARLWQHGEPGPVALDRRQCENVAQSGQHGNSTGTKRRNGL